MPADDTLPRACSRRPQHAHSTCGTAGVQAPGSALQRSSGSKAAFQGNSGAVGVLAAAATQQLQHQQRPAGQDSGDGRSAASTRHSRPYRLRPRPPVRDGAPLQAGNCPNRALRGRPHAAAAAHRRWRPQAASATDSRGLQARRRLQAAGRHGGGEALVDGDGGPLPAA